MLGFKNQDATGKFTKPDTSKFENLTYMGRAEAIRLMSSGGLNNVIDHTKSKQRMHKKRREEEQQKMARAGELAKIVEDREAERKRALADLSWLREEEEKPIRGRSLANIARIARQRELAAKRKLEELLSGNDAIEEDEEEEQDLPAPVHKPELPGRSNSMTPTLMA